MIKISDLKTHTLATTPIELTVNGLRISALRTGQGRPVKILCVHGWLDNAHSFLPLWPQLPDADIVAIDLPGHGRSGHLSDCVQYSFTGQSQTILNIASNLGWNQFHLIGHSLGGCLAPFCAVAASTAVQSITLIDAAGPQTESADQLPVRLAGSFRDLTRLDHFNSRYYVDIEATIEARLRANKMEYHSARLIVERQLTRTDKGYVWSFDRKLRVASARYFTEQQLHAVLKAVECPVLCILAQQSFVINNSATRDRLDKIRNLTLCELPGNHHLHMDTPEPVGGQIRYFLNV
ncbi:hypothetical protein AB833_25490 [Chromatiales bacterium (ex Bugula neritina AB1)]|nr:hypothetical protein AB833_25490 [Chromatiales bacterium (ex Bugula neritina AB1)]